MLSQVQTEIGAGAFKSVITKHGKAVAKLVPMPVTSDLFGAMSGSVTFASDIVSPLDNDWEAARP